jgi:hypothetical protein
MKIFQKFMLVLVSFSLGFPAFGQSTDTSKAVSKDAFFIKAGAGSYFSEWTFTKFDRPAINGIPSEVDTTIGAFNDFAGTLALGLDCGDHFSYFLSGEWLTNEMPIMVNGQYNFPIDDLFQPYAYFGLGLDFMKNSYVRPGSQIGVGANCVLIRGFDVFLETKSYISWGESDDSINPYKGFTRVNIYLPVLAGIKCTL